MITAASLAGRRWGPSVGGWLVGLPFTSGPVSLFLALEQGPHFASEAASGSIAGVLAAIGFAAAYSVTARWGWPAALLIGSAVFAAAAGAVKALPASSDLPLPLIGLFAVATGALIVGLQLMPARDRVAYGVRAPRWDLPARAVVATGVVLLITTIAPALGPQLSGFVTTYPVYAGVLAVFAHRQHGPAAGQQVLRGLLYGLFAFAAFFLAIAASIEGWGIAPAFGAAIAAALVTQSLTLRAMRAT